MKKLSMLLSVAVCSIGLFQSVKGMDDLSIERTSLEKYLLEKHLLEASLTKDLALFIRQLQVAIEIQERNETQSALEAPKTGVAAAFMSGLWNVANKVDWAGMVKGISDFVRDSANYVDQQVNRFDSANFVDRETNKWKDAQQKRFEVEMRADKEKQERLERQLNDQSLPRDYRLMLMMQEEAVIEAQAEIKAQAEKQELFKKYLLEKHLLEEASLPNDLVLFISYLQVAIEIQEQMMKANKEKQERIENQLRDASLPKDYRAQLLRQQQQAIKEMEAMQRKLQTLLQ